MRYGQTTLSQDLQWGEWEMGEMMEGPGSPSQPGPSQVGQPGVLLAHMCVCECVR